VMLPLAAQLPHRFGSQKKQQTVSYDNVLASQRLGKQVREA